jgi:hypothetical protein
LWHTSTAELEFFPPHLRLKACCYGALQIPGKVFSQTRHFDPLEPWGCGGSIRNLEILPNSKDCNVNSASDAIKFSDAPMEVRGLNTIQKLQLG